MSTHTYVPISNGIEEDLLDPTTSVKVAPTGYGTHRVNPPQQVRLYKRRWYLLVVIALLIITQSAIWNTWSPIAGSAEAVFGWKDRDIALLSNWGPIMCAAMTVPFSWIVDNKGLRVVALLVSCLIVLGSGSRCITSQQPAAGWLINAGHVLNAIGGVVIPVGCTKFSVTWFPSNQRATATAIIINSYTAGVAVSFLVGPLLVPSMCNNGTPGYNSSLLPNCTGNITGPSILELRDSIMTLMYAECGVAGAVFLLILVYFPGAPPKPPSTAAHAQRVDFKKGFLCLLRMKKYWLLTLAYSVSMGLGVAFNGVLGVDLKAFNIPQTETGFIGFWSIIAGSSSAVVIALISDKITGYMKFTIAALLLLGGLTTTWSTLMLAGVIPFSLAQIYAASIMTSVFMNAASPLFFELACETTYPVAEGVTVGLMAFMGNLVTILFLFLLLVPKIGIIWMNWSLMGALYFCFGVMLLFRGTYKRLELESKVIVAAG